MTEPPDEPRRLGDLTTHWVTDESCCNAIAKKYGWKLEDVWRDRQARDVLPVRCTFRGSCQFPCYGGKADE